MNAVIVTFKKIKITFYTWSIICPYCVKMEEATMHNMTDQNLMMANVAA